MKITILSIGIFHIPVSGHGRGASQQGDGVFFHIPHQMFAALFEFSGSNHQATRLMKVGFHRGRLHVSANQLHADAHKFANFGISQFVFLAGSVLVQS